MRLAPLLLISPGKGKDCGIVALSSFIGATYDQALRAARKVCNRPEELGMFDSDVMRAAKRLGIPLRRKTTVDLASDCGILCLGSRRKLRSGEEASGHFVVLMNGLIFDNVEVWSPLDYFKHSSYHIRAILAPDFQ